MPELPFRDGCLYYECQGEGQPLVALRGLGRSIRHWLGYDQELAKHFRVITFDLRGVGRSTCSASYRDSIFDLASDVFRVLDALKIDSAHIMGVSLGGMVTLAAGLSEPARCKSLTVVNTSIAGLLRPRLSPAAVTVLLRGITTDRERIHELLADILVGKNVTSDEINRVAEQFAEIERLEGMPDKTVLRQLAAAARFFVKRRLKDLKVPTMVVYGTHDRFVPNVHSRMLFHLLPQARLVAIEGAGHELTIDKGEELLGYLKEWVDEHR